jgi:hypothetical protein
MPRRTQTGCYHEVCEGAICVAVEVDALGLIAQLLLPSIHAVWIVDADAHNLRALERHQDEQVC